MELELQNNHFLQADTIQRYQNLLIEIQYIGYIIIMLPFFIAILY